MIDRYEKIIYIYIETNETNTDAYMERLVGPMDDGTTGEQTIYIFRDIINNTVKYNRLWILPKEVE